MAPLVLRWERGDMSTPEDVGGERERERGEDSVACILAAHGRERGVRFGSGLHYKARLCKSILEGDVTTSINKMTIFVNRFCEMVIFWCLRK